MIIPLKDDNPTFRRPVVTMAVIALNVLIFLYQLTLTERGEIIFLHHFGLVPAWISGTGSMLPPPDWFARELTFITYMFLHGGFFHLGFNMWFLWIFGNNIEDALGPLRFTLFYLAGGVFACLSQVLINSSAQIPVVGASGAIAAVLGAYLVLYPAKKVSVLLWIIIFVRVIEVPAVIVLGTWFILQVIWSLGEAAGGGGGGVAWMAHIGGFVFGLFTIRLFGPKISQGPGIYQN
jgi:membrane associated rhomboid family serine protease